MFGGNPNFSSTPFKPLAGHHLKQQSGMHNAQGLGGITAGQNAVQPMAAMSSNSLPSINYTSPGGGMHRMENPYATNPRYDWLPERFRPPVNSDGTTLYDRAMRGARGEQMAHYDKQIRMARNYQQQLAGLLAGQRQERARQELLAQRDAREAQAALPRSGTHVFYGF